MGVAGTLLVTAQKLLWGGTLVACAALLMKLCAAGLQRTFPLFFILLAYRVVRGLGLYYLPQPSNLYSWAWGVSLPLLWLAYILVILELYALVLRNYPGIASLGRWVLVVGLVVSIGVSGVSLKVDLSNPSEGYQRILIFTTIERGVMSSLAIFLLLITLFLVWYPVPLSRNVMMHSMVCAIYFLGTTMGLLIRNLTGHQVTVAVNIALSVVDLTCLILWAALLSRAGETTSMMLRQSWRAEEQQRLMAQLDSINATLLRAVRKPHEGC